MFRGNMIPEVVQVTQLYIATGGMLTGDRLTALPDALILLQMSVLEMVVHHGSATVREGSFLIGQPFIPDTNRTLSLLHQKWEDFGFLLDDDSGLHSLPDAALSRRLPLVAEGGH